MLSRNQRIGEYVLLDPIAAGTCGEVWKAQHHAWQNQTVALKVPTDQRYVRELRREGSTIHQLAHPGIVKAIAFDPYADPAYLAMELVEGTSLRPLIRDKSLTVPDALAIMRQVLAALSYAHSKSVIHRDIKPENILVDHRAAANGFSLPGTVKLTDFGLGRVTSPSSDSIIFSNSDKSVVDQGVIGSLEYMSPEQRRGETTDVRADLYACGVLLFEMLTSQRPEGLCLPSHLNPLVPKHIDDAFASAFARLENRVSSADQFLELLTAPQWTPTPAEHPTRNADRFLELLTVPSPSYGEHVHPVHATGRGDATAPLNPMGTVFPLTPIWGEIVAAERKCEECRRQIAGIEQGRREDLIKPWEVLKTQTVIRSSQHPRPVPVLGWLKTEIVENPSRTAGSLCSEIPSVPTNILLPVIDAFRSLRVLRIELEIATSQLIALQRQDFEMILDAQPWFNTPSERFPTERWPALEQLLAERRYIFVKGPADLLHLAEQRKKVRQVDMTRLDLERKKKIEERKVVRDKFWVKWRTLPQLFLEALRSL